MNTIIMKFTRIEIVIFATYFCYAILIFLINHIILLTFFASFITNLFLDFFLAVETITKQRFFK